jgi:hypothetical protein
MFAAPEEQVQQVSDDDQPKDDPGDISQAH